MKRIVFADYSIGTPGLQVDFGIMSLDPYPHYPAMKQITIRNADGKVLMHNPVPVPQWAMQDIFSNWMRNIGAQVIWPLPKNYIKNLR